MVKWLRASEEEEKKWCASAVRSTCLEWVGTVGGSRSPAWVPWSPNAVGFPGFEVLDF